MSYLTFHYPCSILFVRSVVRGELQKYRDDARDALNELLQLESVPLYTQNLHYLQDCRAKWLKIYETELSEAYGPERIIGRYYDPYTEELKLMADVRAYFKVAYKVRRRFQYREPHYTFPALAHHRLCPPDDRASA